MEQRVSGSFFCLMFNVSGLRLKLTTFQLFLFSIRFHSPHRAVALSFFRSVALSYPRPSTTDHAETRQAMSLLTPHSSDSLLKTHYLSHSHAFHPFPLAFSPPRSVVQSLFRSFALSYPRAIVLLLLTTARQARACFYSHHIFLFSRLPSPPVKH